MTGKNTKAKRCIEKLGLLYGVNYDDKTYKNIKKILECYREYVFEQDIFDFTCMGIKNLMELLKLIYKSFISNEPINDRLVNSVVIQIINDDSTRAILEKTLDKIQSFRCEGEDYYFILVQLYFSKENTSNTDIYLDLNLSPTQYSYRKEEAVMLFGVFFWQECLKLWDEWEKEITDIKIEMGRNDLIHENQTA